MMPKQSSTTSASWPAAALKPYSVTSGNQLPLCGLSNSNTVSPRNQPAAATCLTAISA